VYSLGITAGARKRAQHVGALLDLSIHGAAGKFSLDADPRFEPGAVAQILISSPMHEEQIKTPARVVYKLEVHPFAMRYGFEFIDEGNVYSQLGVFYARFFNRRRMLRVRPTLGEPIDVSLWWGGFDAQGTLYDLSTESASVRISRETALRLHPADQIWLRWSLTKNGPEVGGSCHVARRTAQGTESLLAVRFDLDQRKGLAEHEEQISRWVLERSEDMSRWTAGAP
jgi:hypothetical protein